MGHETAEMVAPLMVESCMEPKDIRNYCVLNRTADDANRDRNGSLGSKMKKSFSERPRFSPFRSGDLAT